MTVPAGRREHLIGTLRREYLDQTIFWNGLDLRRKLNRFATYYNQRRVHAGLSGRTPVARCGTTAGQPANLDHYAWRPDCFGLFHTPTAA
jgi:putative transposase